ncbi:MAG: hypothetical protein ACOY0T_26355 [Myxococcota bacterium]
MKQTELSEPVRQFLMVYVHTFEDLEVLLAARRLQGTAFAPDAIAQTLCMDVDSAALALGKLSDVGLIAPRSADPLTYEYRPPAALAVRVDELSEAYETQHLLVITAISSNAITRVRTSAIKTFAEAFMLGKRPKK